MAIENRAVTLSDGTAQMIVSHDNTPHYVVLHNATKSSNEYIYIGGSSAVANSTHGLHIDPGQTIYLHLGPEDIIWATSDPNGLEVQVMDVRKND